MHDYFPFRKEFRTVVTCHDSTPFLKIPDECSFMQFNIRCFTARSKQACGILGSELKGNLQKSFLRHFGEQRMTL